MSGSDLLQFLPNDDDAFLSKVGALLAGTVRATHPRELYVVRIDHWFSRQWVGFRCKVVMGLAGAHDRTDFRVPPFVPSRVLTERYLTSGGDPDEYLEAPPPMKLHLEQRSIANDSRALRRLAPDACLLWISSASAETGRGSVMAYEPTPEGHVAWYAGLVRDPVWRYAERVGIGDDLLAYYEARASALPTLR